LLTAFNSGFYEKDSAAGFYTTTRSTSHDNGLATVVAYKDGTVNLIDAGRCEAWPDVLVARQNLPLLVNARRPHSGHGSGEPVGHHARRRAGGLEDRPRHRRQGQPHLRGRRDQTAASLAKISSTWRGARHAARHQSGMAHPDHLWRPGRRQPSIFVSEPASIPTRSLPGHEGLLRRLCPGARRDKAACRALPAGALAGRLVLRNRQLLGARRPRGLVPSATARGPGEPGPTAPVPQQPPAARASQARRPPGLRCRRPRASGWPEVHHVPVPRHEMSEATAKDLTTPPFS